MSRSVVLAGTERCPRCLLPPRWCLCQGPSPVCTPLRVDILMHTREQWRPSSTGRLIERVVTGTRVHVYERHRTLDAAALVDPERELWILHPRGEPVESIPAAQRDPARIQALLLDGSWGESGTLLRAMEGFGRAVRLPLEGPSRYWLRDPQGPGRGSTVEALLALLKELGRMADAAQLALHFELLVYASLRARGQKLNAARYLSESPIRTALPGFLAQLHERRPNLCGLIPRSPEAREEIGPGDASLLAPDARSSEKGA